MFPYSRLEVSGSWSYRLADKVASIRLVSVFEWKVPGVGFRQQQRSSQSLAFSPFLSLLSFIIWFFRNW